MMVKITTKQQFEMLIAQMEANPNLARGIRLFGETKSTTEELWKGIAEQLNSYGPPTRTPDEWQRVWIHFKAKLKKKMAENKRNLYATGGGPSQQVPLSPLEQTAADIINIDLVVNPEGNLFGVAETVDVEEVEKDIEYVEKLDKTKEVPKVWSTPKKRMRTEDKKLEILEEQTAGQTELINRIKKIEKDLYKQNEIMAEIRDIKRKKYEKFKELVELKKKHAAFQEDCALNKEIKRVKLDLLKKQLENMN